MSGYYPDGVTGFEYAIAGPDTEQDETREVAECEDAECAADWQGTLMVEGVLMGYRSDRWFNWTCPICGREQSHNIEDEDERDFEPDYDDEPDWD